MRVIERWLVVVPIELGIYVTASVALKILECPFTIDDLRFEQWED